MTKKFVDAKKLEALGLADKGVSGGGKKGGNYDGPDSILDTEKVGKGEAGEGEGNGDGEGEGEGDDSKSWQDLVREQFGDAGEAEAIQDLGEIFKEMFAEVLMDRGEQGVKDLMFTLTLAAEGLYQDFQEEKFTEFAEVKEENVLALRRMVSEADVKYREGRGK